MSKMKVEEPMAVYGIPRQISNSDVLTFLQTENVDWRHVSAIKKLTDFNDDIISDWLNVSVKTFRSYKQPENQMKENVKEQVLLLISLMKHGIQVFESSKNFDLWLNAKNFHLDGKSPVSFLNTVTGIRFVDDILTGMEYGDNL